MTNTFSSSSHYVGKIVSIQDSIITCDEPYSNCFTGEWVCFNNNINYKGIVFVININKILLLNCDQKNFYINGFIYLRNIYYIKYQISFYKLYLNYFSSVFLFLNKYLNRCYHFFLSLKKIIDITNKKVNANYKSNNRFFFLKSPKTNAVLFNKKQRFYSTTIINHFFKVNLNSNNSDSNAHMKIEEIKINEFTFDFYNLIIDPQFDFEKLSENEQYDFLINQLVLHKLNSLKPNIVSPDCVNLFHKNFFFITDKNDDFSYYFFNVIDYRKNVVSFNQKNKAVFYSFSIIENTSFVKIDNPNKTFGIQLTIVNFRRDTSILPVPMDTVFYSYNDRLFLQSYLNTFVEDHKSTLILETKKTVQLLSQIIDFEKDFSY